MNRRRVLVCISLLLCLLGAPPVGAPQPSPPSLAPVLAQTLQLIQAGRLKDALPPLQQLYTAPLRDALGPDWRKRIPFLLGYVYFRTADYSRAALHFEGARHGYPELQDYALWYLGQALLRLGRIQQASAVFQHMLAAFSDSLHRPEVLVEAAEAHVQSGDLAQAISLYSTYQREYPDGSHHGEVHLRLGITQRDMGDSEGALREWRHLWLEHPEDPAAAIVPELERTLPPAFVVPPVTIRDLHRRAERLYRLNRFREALETFEMARSVAPEEPVSDDMRYHIGMAQYHTRENSAAVATFRQLFERTPRAPLGALALLMVTRLHLRMEADELFLDTARDLMNKFAGSPQAEEVSYLLGHFHRNRGRIVEAMQAFRRVIQRGKESEFADDAWWYLGWMQYGIGEYQQATQTWGNLLRAFPSSSLVPDALYWQGRAFERIGRREDARSRYERLRTYYRQTYYGYLATFRLTGRSQWFWEAQSLEQDRAVASAAFPLPELPDGTLANPHVIRGAELWAMRLFSEAAEELQVVPAERNDLLRYQWWAAQAFHWAGQDHRALNIVRRHSRTTLLQAVDISSGDLQEMSFPLGALQQLDNTSLRGLDPLFIGALVMAESGWNPRAFSRVGARGLMQLMPETGRRAAHSVGMDLSSDDQLFDVSLNLRLGIAHFRDLLQRFDRQLPLVVASYNAGEEQVSRWWAQRGGQDMEEFIANIPFRETRRYVQRVFVYYAEYQRIYRGLQG